MYISGCQFNPVGEYLRFVRIPENLRVGERVMSVEINHRKNLTLEAVDKVNYSPFLLTIMVLNLTFTIGFLLVHNLFYGVNEILG